METNSKPVLQFSTRWTRFKNKFKGKPAFLILTGGVGILMCAPLFRKSIENAAVFEAREKWIVKEVKNPNISIKHLDREEDPEPLPKMSNRELFRAKFNEIRETNK